MNTKKSQVQYGIRVPQELLDRVDKLAAHMSKLNSGTPVVRAEVLRRAAFEGIGFLEEKYYSERVRKKK
jgi:predicted DNA-binding protein